MTNEWGLVGTFSAFVAFAGHSVGYYVTHDLFVFRLTVLWGIMLLFLTLLNIGEEVSD